MLKKLSITFLMLTACFFIFNVQQALALISYTSSQGLDLCCISAPSTTCIINSYTQGEVQECFRTAECIEGTCTGVTESTIKTTCSAYNLNACDKTSCQAPPRNFAWDIVGNKCYSSSGCTNIGQIVITGTAYGKICTSSTKPSCGAYPCVYYDITTESACTAKPGDWLAPYNGYDFCEAKNPIETCTSFTYSPWSDCVNGSQSRTITAYIPEGCTGGAPEALTQTCTVTPPTCTSWTYSAWSTCDATTNTQTRTITNSLPDGCAGGSSVTSQSCTPAVQTCTWTYSDWSTCDATTKTQTRTVTGGPSPDDCAGGTQEELTKACTPATGCAALSSTNCTKNPACQSVNGACTDKPKLTETCTGTGTGNCSEGQCIAFEGKSICRKTCTSNTDCPTGNFCFDSGAGKFCRTLLQTGAACTDGGSCASGVCEANVCKAPIKCTDYSTADTTGAICNSHPECEWVSNACSTKDTSGGSVTDPGGGSAPPASSYAIPNFLSAGGTMDDPSSLVARIIKVIMGFAGTIALATFMYGGSLWLISAGRVDYVTKGKNYMIWAVIGLALVFGSYIILGQILTILGK